MHNAAQALIDGIKLQQAGRVQEAESIFRQVLAAEPHFVYAWHLLGVLAHQTGRHDMAVQCIRQALQLQPDYAEGYLELGWIFQDQGRLDEAIIHYQQALQLNPTLARAYANLGNALKDQGKLAEAIACQRRGLEIEPASADIHTNLGIALLLQGEHDQAQASFLRALQLQPDHPLAHNGLGAVLKDEGRLDDAAAHFARAAKLAPDLADIRFNQARLWLLRGDFERGWPEYEWRLHGVRRALQSFAQPRWDGASLAGKTILLHAEQGLGDTIQFIRYVPWLKRQGATVVLKVQRALLPLLRCFPVDRLVAIGDESPPADVYCPLLSLPGHFGTSLTTIPADVPYLFATPALVQRWRERLGPIAGLKVGIAWQGNAQYRDDRERSIPLAHFAPLARVSGVTLVSLQKGRGSEQLAQLGGELPVIDLGDELDEASGAFMDTAAIMNNLDLVITSDTAIAHLAGALGVRVWLALPFVPDFRWLMGRTDSPWYPTMRLFRQQRRGDWAGAFREMEAAVRERLADSR